jgi:hypothetical protein
LGIGCSDSGVAGAIASIVVTVRAGEIVRMGDYLGYDHSLAVAGLTP